MQIYPAVIVMNWQYTLATQRKPLRDKWDYDWINSIDEKLVLVSLRYLLKVSYVIDKNFCEPAVSYGSRSVTRTVLFTFYTTRNLWALLTIKASCFRHERETKC